MTASQGIENAKLDWCEHAPRSVAFDDVYFSGDGLEEARHVFLDGNDLPRRFETASRFVIGELGFGTGLNFLAAWDAWRRTSKPDNATLNFLSFEAFPLSLKDMTHAHHAWPHFTTLSEKLRAEFPPPVAGFHLIELEHDVTLTLYYGDALAGLKTTEGGIDAWFFVGFAPSKNPEMWTPEIFAEAARISGDNTTYATFTVAGAVRRALVEAGFSVEKFPGFGRKKEMLCGKLDKSNNASSRRPWFDTRPKSLTAPGAHIAIIGAGIAGASMAHSLMRMGFRITVYDTDQPASGASGNPAGLIMPRLDIGDTPAARFHKSAYLYTLRLINDLQKETQLLFNPCGVLLHASDEGEQQRQGKIVTEAVLPPDWISAHEAGLFFPQAGVVGPRLFVGALLGEASLKISRVTRIIKSGSHWILETAAGEKDEFDAVIIANGLDTLRFSQLRSLPLAGSAGQIDLFPEARPPDHAHAFGPYAAPTPHGGVVIGATYAPIAIGREPRFTPEATRSNIEAVRRRLPALAQTLAPETSKPRAAVRCTTPDRLPVVGPVPDWGFYGGAFHGLRNGRQEDYPQGETFPGLFVLTGFGSRGLVTAPYAAAILAAELAGAPSPADIGVAEALHPARFFIRDLKRKIPAHVS